MKLFRLMTVRISLGITILFAGLAWFLDETVAKGILAGGLAGIISFWIISLRLEKVALNTPSKVQSASVWMTFPRLCLYLVTLWWAYTLEPNGWAGFLGAAGGLFIIQVVQVILGLTGWDLKQEKRSNGTNR